MKKRTYIIPEVGVTYLDTEKLMKVSEPSDPPTSPGAPEREKPF